MHGRRVGALGTSQLCSTHIVLKPLTAWWTSVLLALPQGALYGTKDSGKNRDNIQYCNPVGSIATPRSVYTRPAGLRCQPLKVAAVMRIRRQIILREERCRLFAEVVLSISGL